MERVFINESESVKNKTNKYNIYNMQDKDWTGNKNSIFKTLGASNHTDKDRQNEDYYATDPIAAELLLEVEQFSGNIWECSSGEDHLANVFKERGYNVRTSDIIPRTETTEVLDFLSPDNNELWDGDIITNPPYKFAVDFIYKALELIPDGKKSCNVLENSILGRKGT